MRPWNRVAVLAGLVIVGACGQSQKSPAGFRLPDGDVQAGQLAFVDLKCTACHQVAGLELPAPVAEPPVPVVLGGDIPYQRTDGWLVTAIIHPSHRIAPAWDRTLVKVGSISRMPNYGDVMTVRQMIDLVAFLHSRYRLVPPPSM